MNSINTTSYPILEKNGFQITSVDISSFSQYESWIARAYKDVFNASAWQEWVKCSKGCWFKSTFEKAPTTCPDCQGGIEDYYSNQEISESVQNVMSKSYFQCLLLLKDQNVIWFTWWWKDSMARINEEKLWLWNSSEWSSVKYLALLQNMENYKIKLWNLYYQSETGIAPEYRTSGLGSALVWINEQLLRDNRDKVDSIIQRTSRKSPMYAIRKNLWYTEVYSYDDSDERVLFARNNS